MLRSHFRSFFILRRCALHSSCNLIHLSCFEDGVANALLSPISLCVFAFCNQRFQLVSKRQYPSKKQSSTIASVYCPTRKISPVHTHLFAHQAQTFSGKISRIMM